MVAHKNTHHYNFNDIKVHIKVNEIQAECFIFIAIRVALHALSLSRPGLVFSALLIFVTPARLTPGAHLFPGSHTFPLKFVHSQSASCPSLPEERRLR